MLLTRYDIYKFTLSGLPARLIAHTHQSFEKMHFTQPPIRTTMSTSSRPHPDVIQ